MHTQLLFTRSIVPAVSKLSQYKFSKSKHFWIVVGIPFTSWVPLLSPNSVTQQQENNLLLQISWRCSQDLPVLWWNDVQNTQSALVGSQSRVLRAGGRECWWFVETAAVRMWQKICSRRFGQQSLYPKHLSLHDWRQSEDQRWLHAYQTRHCCNTHWLELDRKRHGMGWCIKSAESPHKLSYCSNQ